MSNPADPGAAGLEISRRVIEQLEAERDRLEDLLLRLPALLAELDPERLTIGIVDAARALTGARFGLCLPAGSERGTVMFVGLGRDDFAEPPAVGRAPILAGALVSGESLRIDDVAVWAPSEEAARSYGVLADGRLVRSWMAAPVRGRDGGVLGVVYLGHHRAHAFGARHERLVAGLCAQLGAALEHCTLFAERSRVASALSESLLPPLLPSIPGLDAAARYRPSRSGTAGPGNVVGGDFYDLFELGDGRFGVVLGDVSGVGPEAAALTGVARYTVRAVAAPEEAPCAVLARLNEALLRLGSERFLTATYATLEPKDAGAIPVVLCSGGHPPALVLRDDETVEVLDRAGGMLLGVFPTVELTDQRVELGPGDALVLVTDGVLEARDGEGRQFGLDGLTALLCTCAGRSAAGIARRIERSVLDHRGDRAEDDVAIVVLRASG
ncbi:MAG TPA: GAF domain-containing SpoIIE family protein phosphatase [Acidimicrobiia bacterium]|nr:GAF domain-containing SpoIIE family protein phosphatase [Acidimicrobiia bacterium]